MPSGYRVIVDPEKVREMYLTQRMSLSSIATSLGCCVSRVKSELIKVGATPKKHPLTPDFVLEDVRRQYLDENVTMRAIATQYGCNPTTVRDFIIEHGFLKKVGYIRKELKKFAATKEQLRDMYIVRQMSDPLISKELGVSIKSVATWRAKWGIAREHRLDETVLDVADLKRLYVDEGHTMADVGKMLGTNGSIVRYNLVKHGLILDLGHKHSKRVARNILKRKVGIKEGYRRTYLPDHPSANKAGYVEEHRHIVQIAIGRLLSPVEKVHHINMKRGDNRIENLAVIASNSEHFMVHRYMDRLCVYMLGLSDIKPPNLKFKEPTFWGGKYIEELDLLAMCDPKDFRLTH